MPTRPDPLAAGPAAAGRGPALQPAAGDACPEPPLVTVLVPVRNRKALTLRCLERLARQTHRPLQVVVIDSNSSDGTPEAIRLTHPEVVLLAATDADFWAGATNIGVQHALASGSEWLLTLNDDAVIADDHIARLLQLAGQHGCAILGSQINHLDDPEHIWSLGTFTIWGGAEMLRLGHHGERSSALPPAEARAAVLPVDALAGNGVLLHHSVFRRIGAYNARWLPHYHADSELVMRAVAAGIPAWVTPQLVLLNDFSPRQKRLPLNSIRGLWWSLGHPKSHLYLPPLLYILWRYCPARQKPASLLALLRRFLRMRR